MILITGANGFIGSHLTPLIRKKYRNEKIFFLNEGKYDLISGKNLDKIPDKSQINNPSCCGNRYGKR